MILKYLIQKEFLQIRRNSFLPRLILMYPIMVMCVLPWVMNMEVKNVVVDVVDNDRSQLSQQLVHQIEESNYFIFGGQKNTYKEALHDIESLRCDIIVEIPQHYSRDRQNGQSTQILIAANAVNGTKGSMGGMYMSQIVNPSDGAQLVRELYEYNRNLDYKKFMIPALFAMLLMLICGFLPTLNIVAEKEAGTIEAINVTPVSKWTFILAKLIPYWLIGLFVVSVSLLLSWLVYGFVPVGSVALIYLISILLAFIFSGIGLVISNYNESMQQAVFVMWFIVVCLMQLSGLFTPSRSMPEWAYAMTKVNPVTYYVDAIRTLFVRGGTFSSVSLQVAGLFLFALLTNFWAVLSYRKNHK